MRVLKQWIILWLVLLAWNASAQQTTPCKEYLDKALSLYFSDPDSSDTYTSLALECAERNNSPHDKALALAYRGKYLLLKADLEEAQKSLNDAHQLALEHDDVKCIAYVLKLKSILQDRIGNSEESTLLLEQSLSMYEKAGDRKGVNSARVNLSLDYIETGKFDKAEDMLERIRVSLKEDSGNAYFYYQNLGKLRLAQQKTSDAIDYLHQAAKTAQRRKMIDSEATVLMILGQAYLSVKNYILADTCLRRSEQIAISNKLDHELDETYAVYIQLYSEQGKYREAFETLTKKTALRDKMLNIEKINSIAALEKKLALSEKEKQLVNEKHKSQEARAQTERLYYVVALVLLILAYTAVMYFRTRNLKNKITVQNKELGIKNNIIEARNKDIMDSIEYAGRIQNSIIPSPETLQQYFTDSFVLFRPKDVVSGDFYWVEQSGKEVILAVADCTGHGVPGALMSVIGANLLNEAVNEHGIAQPAAILNRVRKNLIAFLQKNNAESGVKDGMDICIISWNRETQTLQYAGAYNSLYMIRDNVLTEFAADKTPVGIYFSDATEPFTNHAIPVKSGDCFYLFTDGFADQFGGPRGKKFKYRQLQETILSVSTLPMLEQKTQLEQTFDNWRGNLEQVDDVCVVGVRV